MKKGLALGAFLVSLSLINFASAFSLSDTLSFIDPSLLTLAVLFVVIFAILNLSLSKIFKGNPSVSAVIAISVSLLSVYWINQSFSLGALFAGFGISDQIIYTVGPILFLALIIFLIIKLKFTIFLVLGAISVLMGISGLVYSGGIMIAIGSVLIIIGLFTSFSKKGRIRVLYAKYRKLQRRYGPTDPKLREIMMKLERLNPGITRAGAPTRP